MMSSVVEMKKIVKDFNCFRVLDNVDFELKFGEIHALLGENGAGKSTLMKILRGIYHPEAGEIIIKGKLVKIRSPKDSRMNGISMVFQEFSLVSSLTIAQNIFLTRESRTKIGLLDDRNDEKRASILLSEMGVDIDPKLKVEQLSAGYRQIIEIVSALSQDAQVLILDEPTSSLTYAETKALFSILNTLKTRGISIIYISHRMEEIFQIADRITILRDGKNRITDYIQNLTIEQVIEYILGRKVVKDASKSNYEYNPNKAPLLEVKNLNYGKNVQDVSLKLFPGEVIGIAGLLGSGRTELAQTLFGITPAQSGEILVKGEKAKIDNAKCGINAGISYVPEDRRKQGLVTMHSIKNNFELPLIIANNICRSRMFINDRKITNLLDNYIKKLNIRTDSINKEVCMLSGGNQQKVVIAKWLSLGSDILILDEPTVGVDIGTKTEILEIARSLANNGKGVIMISSELHELMSISDRILIIKQGSIVREMKLRDICSVNELHQILQGAQNNDKTGQQ